MYLLKGGLFFSLIRYLNTLEWKITVIMITNYRFFMYMIPGEDMGVDGREYTPAPTEKFLKVYPQHLKIFFGKKV